MSAPGPDDEETLDTFPPSFASHLREHLRPRLELRLPAAALDVALGLASYSDSWGSLWWFARFRGASFLSAEMAVDLEEWLHRRLLEEIDRVEAEVEPNIAERGYLAELPISDPKSEPPDSDTVWASYEAGHQLEVVHG